MINIIIKYLHICQAGIDKSKKKKVIKMQSLKNRDHS